jgi:Xaa-Pro aminopeptidase
MDVAGRAPRLRAALTDCDALVVTSLVNIRYLTGFTGSAALLLVLPDSMLFVTDGRYEEQSAEQLAAAGVDAKIEIGLSGELQRDVVAGAARGIARIGLEAGEVTWARQRAMATDWFPDAALVPTEGLVEQLRLVKDDGEVARIEAAAAIATQALTDVLPRLWDGPTESEFGLELDTQIRRLGAEGNSFDTIVGSGPNGAKPHHRAAGSARRIAPGDLVVFDYGARVDGYCSDMTRTVVLGDPTPEQARMLDVVAESQRAGVAAVRAGVSGRAVDEACRAVIRAAGWGDAFSHGTGHGVGLQIHEAPRVTWAADDTLVAGSVVTVEPGVYLPEHGGVRIEDTVVVTDDGCRTLTHAPKDPAWPSPRTT